MAEFDSPEVLKAIEELNRGNYSVAVALLVPLAEAGNPKAQCNLASLYHLGLGVESDGKRAVELYKKVAEHNVLEGNLSALAYNNLATIYFTGAPGVEADWAKANAYLTRARDLGFEM
ncbi:MAG TPA: hypothetical protein VKT50_10790 [Candidatus Acidoferrales bacterium]|nr:hypothetical protein [Candidatus Acidoferrales bacterium]